MKVKVLFFGNLTDITGKDEINVADITSTHILDLKLQDDFPDFKKMTYRIAVNREMCDEDSVLNNGDEVAFMPPFAGG